MTTLIDTVDGPRPVYKAKRSCVVCGALYVSPHIKVKTCSPSCGSKLNARLNRPLPSHTCHGCGVRFKRKRARFKYCGRACALKHTEDRIGKQRHVADGALAWMQSWSECKVCGTTHTFSTMHCSPQCKRLIDKAYYRAAYVAAVQELPPYACKKCGVAIARTTDGRTGPKKWCVVCAGPSLAASKRKCRRVSKATRRARIRQLPIEKVDPYDIFARDGWRCQMCLRQVDLSLPVNHDLRPNLDHIIPVSKGGSHTRNNLQCLCRRCNMDKSDKLL